MPSQRLPYSSFLVLLLWDNNLLDIDLSAMLLTQENKILGDNYFVFYNSHCRTIDGCSLLLPLSKSRQDRPCDPDTSVVEIEFELESDYDYCSDGFVVNLNKVRPEIQEILFVASVYDTRFSFKGDFGIIILKDNKIVFEEHYSEKFEDCNALETIKIRRAKDGWFVDSIGAGYHNGLQAVIEKYG
jgi:stress response protein SCP2